MAERTIALVLKTSGLHGPGGSNPPPSATYAATVHVILVRPEIAPNTGAIIRLCANTGCDLHLIEPLGFDLDDRLLKRGGLDYHEHTSMQVHPSLADLLDTLPGRRFGFSSHARHRYTDIEFTANDVLVFGAERTGLSDSSRALIPDDQLLLIPMQTGSRSLNLANAASVVVYEAWRQQGFAGAAQTGASTSETPGAEPFDR
jgi:tRNA (cytidine/uridine-2'-O-)-methyltransferase